MRKMGKAGHSHANGNGIAVDDHSATTPICRCRVMYLGSAVPLITKDGLQGIQEPLRDLYPEQGLLASGISGIDSWLSVWSNGILVENVDDHGNDVKRFHPIESLHYCAAVRFVAVPRGLSAANGNGPAVANNNSNNTANSTSGASTGTLSSDKVAKFLPLDSPFSRYADTSHPPLFACILRRTTGIKVLECHAFICKKEAAANALVRCCFHAYADTIHAKQIDTESPYEQLDRRRSRSISALDTVEKVEEWRNRSSNHSSHDDDVADGVLAGGESLMNGHHSNGNGSRPRTPSANSIISNSQDEEHYKAWSGQMPIDREAAYLDGGGTLRSMRSTAANSLVSTTMRTQKPRQIAIPCAVPPPPLPPPLTLVKGGKKCKKKESTLKKKHKYKGMLGQPPPHLLANSYPITIISAQMPSHAMAAHHPLHHPPHPHLPAHAAHHHAIYAPPSSIYSDGRRLVHRRPTVPPPPPPLPHLSHHSFIHEGYPPPSILLSPNDEPIYMPTMRPMTPLSGYHPIHGEPAMFVQYGQPTGLHMASPSQRSLSQREYLIGGDGSGNGSRPHRKDKKKSSTHDDSESPFSTGIYKKKGHLNERAFSYSIRQEHRSRSNSLSNLHFDGHDQSPVTLTNGDAPHAVNNSSDNYNSRHSASTTIGGALTERELSERLSTLKINGNGLPPPPPPPPPNARADRPKTASIKRSLHSKANGVIKM